MSNYLLYLLVFIVAIVYSSAGFGGASGYLLVMSFFNIPTNIMSSTALMLNILVATISFISYARAGHLRLRLLIPFLITSLPAVFLGGYIKISQEIYMLLLYIVLTYLALRMILLPVLSEAKDWQPRPMPFWASLLSGAVIGLLSGILGIGGGILLSPLIILAQWGNSKEAAASAGGFIALNSIGGLVARFANGTFAMGEFGIALLVIGATGALIGGQLGALKFSHVGVRRTLGIILMIAVGTYWFK